MLPLLLVLCAPLCGAGDNPSTAQDKDRSPRILDPMPSGRFAAEFETTYTPPSEAAFARAARHYGFTREACHVAGPALDGGRVAFHGRDLPNCLLNARTQEERIRFSERLELTGPWLRSRATLQTNVGGVPVVTWRIWEPSGLVAWSTQGSGRASSVRSTHPSPDRMTLGLLLLLDRWATQIEILTDLARARGTLELGETGDVHLLAALDDSLVLDRFSQAGATLGNGVPITPGYAELALRHDATGRQLSVHFRDCTDAEMLTYRMRWEGDDPMPSRIESLEWVVGTGEVYRRQVVRVSRLGGAVPTLEDVAWKPRAGELVQDSRFGSLLTYRAAADGGLPAEIELAMRAEGELARGGLRLAGEAPDAARSFAGSSGDGGGLTLVEAPGRITAPLGSEVPARFVLENQSGSHVILGAIEITCGVSPAEQLPYEGSLEPGETFSLDVHLSPEVAGENRFQISVPYTRSDDPGAGGRVECEALVDAIDLGLLDPPQLRVGPWIGGQAFPETELEFRRTGSAQALPRTRAEGPFGADPAPLEVVVEPARDGARIRLGPPQASSPWGCLAYRVEVEASPDSPLAQAATVLIERIPEALAASWPGGTLVLVGGYPRSRTFACEGLEIRAARLSPTMLGKRAPTALRVTLAPDRGAVTIEETDQGSAPTSTLARLVLILETDQGPMHVQVYSAPAEPAR